MSTATRFRAEAALAAVPELGADEPATLIAAIRRGLPAERFEALHKLLDVSASELASVVGISPSTLSRRRRRGDLESDESERLLRIARLLARAIEVFEDLEEARVWMKRPARALGGEVPLRFADTEPGAREVERLLLRLEYGVYS